MATQDSRIKLKRSTVNSTVPTVPSSNDHTDGTWIATDIYKGELFYNQADNVLWTRGDSGIECIQGTAKLTIASADVLTLNTTPITIVAAQGVGTVIEVLSAFVSIDFNTTGYATNTTLQVVNNLTSDPQFDGDVLGALSSENLTLTPSLSSLTENQDLVVSVATNDPDSGDSDITVYVTYRIIKL